jgi:D-psicose/D-tagatose/L-ribulose 3-epimerase
MEPTGNPLPIGANTWIWFSPPTDERIAALAPRLSAWGFDIMELPVENPGDWDPPRTAELLAGHGLRATVCAVMPPGRELAAADDATVGETSDYLRRCIDAAATVSGDARGIVAGPMYTSVGRLWRLDGGERAALIEELAGSLAPLAEYAGERGVRLAVEPLNRFETGVLNTAEQALELIETVDSPALGILLDTFHMNVEEKNLAAAVRAVGPRLAHFHACGSDRGTPGEDHTDWPEISQALAEVGYCGPVCIESFTAENETIATAAAIWRPLAASQDEIATGGLQFLRRTLVAPRDEEDDLA